MRFVPVARRRDPFAGMRSGASRPMPGVRFRSVVGSAFLVEIAGGGRSLGYRDDVVVIAPPRGHGTDRVGADAIAVADGKTQLSGREPAEFGDIEQVPAFVHQPMEQRARLPCEIPDRVCSDRGGGSYSAGGEGWW